ncbi:MAG TPA: regulatory iron-sulfur-containing complex subunit RicT [Candidatus Cloacimonadota bacterium]|nr:regulatory iron-sulfur-containing complex subunit RicT [Candidatus Cloacimonadota bacterium]HOQ80056.1 regulatory iron-sulfur-containing complex subunit RicT [Candidatus Cloacimonadota bacterium]HPK40663.1 regulatory iron-sulfur-containing complex subunit RicT [Candidatus Cloacimonadota bacterium]
MNKNPNDITENGEQIIQTIIQDELQINIDHTELYIETEEAISYTEQQEFVEVEMRNWRTAYFTKPENLYVQPDDVVIVQVDRGLDIGVVVQAAVKNEEQDDMQQESKVLSIVRIATDNDLQQLIGIEKKEKAAEEKFLELVVKYPFEMKLIDTKYQFDTNKLTFFFTAEGRIDFREFVRELAQVFRTRIELHQSTGRDEAKRLGGYGMCGNKYCCASFLKRFNQVTIKMAKDQNLSGNLAKISGPCGRLLCCLHFEGDFYTELAKDYPEIGEEVWVNKKKMYVFRNDYQLKMVYLSGEDQSIISTHIDDFNKQYRGKN